jgi:transposase-like protein
VRVKREWKYLYRAVDHEGQTIDFLLTPHRDTAATEAFLHRAIRSLGLPKKITIDQSGSNTAAIHHEQGPQDGRRHSPLKISQQPRGARPSSGQTHHAFHARLHIVLGGLLYDHGD